MLNFGGVSVRQDMCWAENYEFQDDIIHSTPLANHQVCIYDVIFKYALLYMISTSGSIAIFIHWLEFYGARFAMSCLYKTLTVQAWVRSLVLYPGEE